MTKLKHLLFFISLTHLLHPIPSLLAAEFAPVVEGRAWEFPRDHGAHPNFKTEWWYFTGHAQDASGRIFGFQWTVFRSALKPAGEAAVGPSAWRTNQVYLGHLAISDLSGKRFEFAESSARGSLNLAGASETEFRVWLPGFQGGSSKEGWTLRGEGAPIGLTLNMPIPETPLRHGREGFSPKAEESGRASYYYSQPKLPVQGTLRIGPNQFPVHGEAWMDHEFGSGQMAADQNGWDWMGLPLEGKAALMVYRLRNPSNPAKDFLSGTYVDPQGIAHPLTGKELHLTPSQIWASPRSSGQYPLEWKVEIPAFGVDLRVKADFPDQELDTRASTQVTYWEGSVTVEGVLGTLKTKSRGYLEMTGYAGGFDKKI